MKFYKRNEVIAVGKVNIGTNFVGVFVISIIFKTYICIVCNSITRGFFFFT